MMELNEKLARWAGFRPYIHFNGRQFWLEPTEDMVDMLPYFTTSLDACFKWLVPELPYNFVLQRKGDVFVCEIFLDFQVLENPFRQAAETPSLALCLAIEKLIDAEGGEL